MSSPYTGFATYTPYQFPFKELMAAGAVAQEREDKSYDALGKLQGLLSMPVAPGHEDYKFKTVSPYKTQIRDLVDTGNPRDPQFYRKINMLQNQYLGDPNVQKLIQSKETYDKVWQPIMQKLSNENPIYNMPDILDENNQFKQNDKLYTNLDYVADPKYKEYVNKDLSAVDYKIGNPPKPKIVNIGGRQFLQESTADETRTLEDLRPTISALVETGLDQNFPYFKYMSRKAAKEGVPFDQDYLQNYVEQEAQKWINTKKGKISYSPLPNLESSDKEDKTPFNFTLPGVGLQVSDPTSTSYDLQSKAEEISKSIPILEKDLQIKKNSGQYAKDDKYLIGLERSIQAKKEMANRYQTAFNTEVNKILAGNSLNSTEKALYKKYKDFKFDEDLSLSEIQAALNFNKELKAGVEAKNKVVEAVTKNIKLNNKNLISPGVVLSKSKTLNQEMDDFIERAIPSSNLFDPTTMDLMSDEDINNTTKVSYAGYTERPVAGFGRMIAVQLKDKDNKTLKTAYMEAPLNFKDFLAKNDRGSLQELDIQDNLAELKDNPLFPGGNILIDGENYGRLEIPQRKSPDDPTADSNPDLVMWRDPNGILHQTDIITLSKTLAKLKQMKQ